MGRSEEEEELGGKSTVHPGVSGKSKPGRYVFP